jgi:hypothetical protein
MARWKESDGAGLWLALLLCGSGLVLSGQERARPGVDWPQFRGIDAGGVAEGFPLPVAGTPRRTERPLEGSHSGLAHSGPLCGATWSA